MNPLIANNQGSNNATDVQSNLFNLLSQQFGPSPGIQAGQQGLNNLQGQIPGLGSRLFLDLPPGMNIGTFEDCLILPDPSCVSQVFSPARLSRPVPANPDRAQYQAADFLQMHFDSPATPQSPAGTS